jgi:hypothetical protein
LSRLRNLTETKMSTKQNAVPIISLAEKAVESVCIGQIAALAALRAEMTALSTMMSGMSHLPGDETATVQPGARPADPDPEDQDFDNMPV